MISKEFLLFNAILFFLIFGSVKVAVHSANVLIKENYNFILNNLNQANRDFVKIERLQNKSFFGFQNYFASISFQRKSEKKEILKKITSTLYYKLKEGNQVEAIIIKDSFGNYQVFLIEQIQDEIRLKKEKNQNIEFLCNLFLVISMVFLILYYLKR
ncbi:MAG: hypothetical protein ACK4UJ_02280 [Leptonema sp. (in: bacteria)]